MKIKLIVIGKTDQDYLKQGIEQYEQRIKKYLPFELIVVPAPKNINSLSIQEQKNKEGELLIKYISKDDKPVLLDENGSQHTSVEFSRYLQKCMNSGVKNLTFIVGGPYGFSEEVYERTKEKIALSKMTFSHQMVRLFFSEQLYRALTIIKGERYHHL